MPSKSPFKGAQGKKRVLQTKISNGGYAQFKDPKTGLWTLTHRRVAEKKVGGHFFAGYEVHHIDGDKRDNRPSNLTIMSKAEHHAIHRKK
jgi:hypothetical protein